MCKFVDDLCDSVRERKFRNLQLREFYEVAEQAGRDRRQKALLYKAARILNLRPNFNTMTTAYERGQALAGQPPKGTPQKTVRHHAPQRRQQQQCRRA